MTAMAVVPGRGPLDRRDGLPRLLVVIPLGSLALAGLLVSALCWMSGTGRVLSRIDAGGRAAPSATDDLETGEVRILLGPVGSR